MANRRSPSRKHRSLKPREIVDNYRVACRFDVLAPKPGNVSVYATGHDMSAALFLAAAGRSAPFIAQSSNGIGRSILSAARASIEVARCNTNLGIILLAAPLSAAAALSGRSSLRQRVEDVLDELTIDDAERAFQAIELAEPGGLGNSDAHDVRQAPDITLKAAMTYAAERDRIARQYRDSYVDIFNLGVPMLVYGLRRWHSMKWATVGCFLGFLAAFNDTHVERKFGFGVASELRARAKELERAFKACENPAEFVLTLQKTDTELKDEGVNPGTSADLTVASLMALLLQQQLKR